MSAPDFLKGATPPLLNDGGDALLSMVIALGAEITALSERLETVIDLLDGETVIAASRVDAFQPTPEQQGRRDAARGVLVERLLAPLQREADALAEQARKAS